jgi:predicted RNA methylase
MENNITDNKIAFDKYYTPPTVARWCIEKVYEIIGKENITEVIEPSAGCGMFSLQIPGCKAYDLYPQSEYIEQTDFTELKLDYKKGRLFIGNPPFGGSARKLLRTFYNKACDAGDYIAYIQPASFYNDYSVFNRFEIVYSVILKTHYTNKDLWTSFTIYKRNSDKENFKDEYEKSVVKLKDVEIKRIVRGNNKQHKTKHKYD